MPERENENTDTIVLTVLQKVNPEIEMSDIDVTHRIGKTSDHHHPGARHRPIIVAFTNRRSRN